MENIEDLVGQEVIGINGEGLKIASSRYIGNGVVELKLEEETS